MHDVSTLDLLSAPPPSLAHRLDSTLQEKDWILKQDLDSCKSMRERTATPECLFFMQSVTTSGDGLNECEMESE